MISTAVLNRIHESFKLLYPLHETKVTHEDETIFVDISNGFRFRADMCSDDDGFFYFARIAEGKPLPLMRVSIPYEDLI